MKKSGLNSSLILKSTRLKLLIMIAVKSRKINRKWLDGEGLRSNDRASPEEKRDELAVCLK